MRERHIWWTRVRALFVTAATIVTVAAVTTGLIGVPAGADPQADKDKADRAVQELRQELTESTAKLAAAEAAYAAAEAQLTTARAELAQAEGALTAAKVLEAELAERVERALAAERQAEAVVAEINEDVSASEAELAVIVRQAYQQGPVPEIVLAFDAETVSDYADQLAYLDQMATSQDAVIKRLRGERAGAASAAKLLEQRRVEVAAEREAAAKQVEERRAAEQAARVAAERVEALIAEREAARQAAEQERDEDLRRYQEMQAEAKRLAKLVAAEMAREAAANKPKPSSATSSDAVLSYPVNAPVTSPFGMRYHPILDYWRLHTGTDFGAPTGTSVRAAADGKVIQSGWGGGYGNRIVISHGYIDGVHLVTTYNHLSSRVVSAGERVSRGELVGRVGSTGLSTGPHLHFEVMVNGEFRDPMKWLP